VTSTGTGGAVFGIEVNAAGANGATISQNTINTLSSTGAGTTVNGIAVFGGTTVNVLKNKVYDLSESATTNGTPMRSAIFGVSSITVSPTNGNKIVFSNVRDGEQTREAIWNLVLSKST
jgi:hypothetical protein